MGLGSSGLGISFAEISGPGVAVQCPCFLLVPAEHQVYVVLVFSLGYLDNLLQSDPSCHTLCTSEVGSDT